MAPYDKEGQAEKENSQGNGNWGISYDLPAWDSCKGHPSSRHNHDGIRDFPLKKKFSLTLALENKCSTFRDRS